MHQFQVLRQLGSGSFGRVLKVRRKEDMGIFAMKTIKLAKLSPKEKDSALNEVRLLASIDSPNVIKYKEAFYQDNGNILSIVMEFADGGDLTGLIEKKISKGQRFEENFIWKVALDILQGLKFLHDNSIIHRDIKSANIFFVGGVAKLGDLNVSKVVEEKFATTQTGTPYYTAPEIWMGKKYTSTCDIWSLGCLLYELCSLRPPFMAQDFPGLCKKVTSGYYDPVPSRYSKKLSMLIRKCLALDHMRRSTAKQLLNSDVFMMMEKQDEGEIQLLDTIRCPKVLKFLNRHLPESKYEEKPKTLKIIEQNNSKLSENSSKSISRSLKKIGSERSIRVNSIEKSSNGHRPPLNPSNMQIKNIQVRPYLEIHRNNPQNVVMQSPKGYLKLPRVPSQKNIL